MFNANTISQYINNPQEISIELTKEIWETIGYSSKEKAVAVLKQELIEDVDFAVSKTGKQSNGGRSSDSYFLSYNGLKLFVSSAHTESGRQYRRHLIQHHCCE